MDLHFHLAQTAISRLQLIIDRVPVGQSVTKALQAHSEGMELIQTVEEHLEEARKRVTPASTQTTQDGYLYFFSCLKISEFRMLEAACKPQLLPIERENYLVDAVEHLIDALQARTLNDNTDLHYVATVQMSQLLLAAKRSYTAAKSYAKCLFTLSLIINRSLYNPEDVQEKLSEETVRNVGQSLAAGARDVPWVKLHFGPVSLNERLTAGYASWSFEDVPRVKILQDSSSALLDLSAEDTSAYKVSPAAVAVQSDGRSLTSGSAAPIYKASPPKGVPPLKLPVLDNKKVYVTGEVMHNGPGIASEDGPPGSGLKKKPPPPAGAIPLFALGHNPQYDHPGRGKKSHGVDLQDASAPAQNYFLGPYGALLRIHYRLALE
jgi:exonuclease VII small subunit